MQITRRAIAIGGIGLGMLVPGVAGSQSIPRLGLISTTPESYAGIARFREELRRLGHEEGRTLQLEPRFADSQLDRLPGFAREIVAMQVDVIAVVGAVTVRAVRETGTRIPTVFTVVLDPVADGLVPNAQRPGGTITGATNYDPAQPRAQIHLLKEIVPGLSRVAILGDAGVPDLLDQANRAAAEAEGITPINIRLRGPGEDIGAVFASLREQGAGAVIGLEVPAMTAHGNRVVALAAEARLPVLYPADTAFRNPTIAFGSSLVAAAGRMAGLVDRVLKGASPGDLPLEVVTKHSLIVNLTAARAIGLVIPPAVLARADRVVE